MMTVNFRLLNFGLVHCLFLMACNHESSPPTKPTGAGHLPQPQSRVGNSKPRLVWDYHSFSNPEQVRVQHLDLEWTVLFDQKILQGAATLHLQKFSPGPVRSPPISTQGATGAFPLVLDTRDLKIERVEVSEDGSHFTATAFKLGPADPILGAPLNVQLPERASRVRIRYSTSPSASALQWLGPLQTAGKNHPFLFTQSEAIHARSWIPLQDTPQVRMTYTARVQTPPGLVAVMSAENNPQSLGTGVYRFQMSQPIPSYLIALAVGDLAFRSLGPRTGVYAEPSVIDQAAKEFADTEKMMQATERLYGPYRWGRYDLLVLPPSFPFGGMENPRLTFTTPTILAGDKSLVSLVAHELAHSWSGNLVSNATWSDFWLNEGFTVYLERRIIEEVYGRAREEMEAVLGRQDLEKDLATLEDRDKILYVDLKGRDPDAGFTDVPYEKGSLFLRELEEVFGRPRFDEFLRGYFNHFAFQSITTEDFLNYLGRNLLHDNPRLAARVPVEDWVYKPDIPTGAPRPIADAFAKVEEQANQWLENRVPASKLQTSSWTTQEWLHFLRALPEPLGVERMRRLDDAFRLTHSGNSEIADQWLLLAIRNHYKPAYPRLQEFLTSIGRRKLIKPLYEELVKTDEGKKLATAVYSEARPTYHPIVVATIDEILRGEKKQ